MNKDDIAAARRINAEIKMMHLSMNSLGVAGKGAATSILRFFESIGNQDIKPRQSKGDRVRKRQWWNSNKTK